jgi:hypothetical protein
MHGTMYSLYYSCTAVLVLVPGTYSRTAVLYCSLVHVGALGVYPVQSSTYIVLVPGTYSRTAVCSLVVRGFMAVDKLRENNLEFSKTPVLSSCGLLLLSSDAPVLSSDQRRPPAVRLQDRAGPPTSAACTGRPQGSGHARRPGCRRGRTAFPLRPQGWASCGTLRMGQPAGSIRYNCSQPA